MFVTEAIRRAAACLPFSEHAERALWPRCPAKLNVTSSISSARGTPRAAAMLHARVAAEGCSFGM
ncbi:hypothetical protein WT21_04855 [Burkholderia territorii]|nr:hypothetical protein WT21_04855 [Burkholderia territorii]KWH06952.1 hypothetical protein WT59_24160 [Burkholderia territorii]